MSDEREPQSLTLEHDPDEGCRGDRDTSLPEPSPAGGTVGCPFCGRPKSEHVPGGRPGCPVGVVVTVGREKGR